MHPSLLLCWSVTRVTGAHEGVSYPWPSQGRLPSRAFKNYLGLSCEGSQVYFLKPKPKRWLQCLLLFPIIVPETLSHGWVFQADDCLMFIVPWSYILRGIFQHVGNWKSRGCGVIQVFSRGNPSWQTATEGHQRCDLTHALLSHRTSFMSLHRSNGTCGDFQNVALLDSPKHSIF